VNGGRRCCRFAEFPVEGRVPADDRQLQIAAERLSEALECSQAEAGTARLGLGDRGLRAAANSRWVVPACSRAWRSSIPVFLVASVGAQAGPLARPAVESGNPGSAHGRRSCRATRQTTTAAVGAAATLSGTSEPTQQAFRLACVGSTSCCHRVGQPNMPPSGGVPWSVLWL
jgi:hypothetical protein